MSNTVPPSRARQKAAAAKTPGQNAVIAIKAGTCDTELAAIAEAISERVQAGLVKFSWRVVLDDLEIGEDDMTLDEAMKAEKASGTTWLTLDPRTSAAHCQAILSVVYQTRGGLTAEQADEKLRNLTVKDLLGAFKAEANADSPLA